MFIIGEIGINHNGSVDTAKRIIDLAVEAGCDAVKFQKRDPDMCVPDHQKGIMRETPWGNMTYLEYKKKIEFEKEEYDEINQYCKSVGIDWFASAWDMKSFEFLKQYNTKFNKIASAMLTNTELLEAVVAEGKRTFVSTGMSSLDEIDTAVNVFRKYSCPFTVMACTSTYPCEVEECNVKFVETLKSRYPDSMGAGYSGHEKGVLPTVLAVALGADVVERHITIDRTMWGTDQAASLGPDGIKRLCRDARNVPKILGDGNKVVYDSEKIIKAKLRP